MKKEIVILNSVGGGRCSFCLKANYYKVSLSNFIHDDGRRATGVIEMYGQEISEDIIHTRCETP